MSNLTLKHNKSWISKPPLGSQINWGHPLAKGLVGCWLMNEGAGGIIQDIARKNKGVLSSGMVWLGGKPKFNGSSSINCGNSSVLAPPEITVFVVASTTITTGLQQPIFEKDYTSAAEPYYVWRLSFGRSTDTPSGRIDAQWNQGGTRYYILGSEGVKTGEKAYLALTIKSGTQKLYKNGRVIASATNSGAITNYNTNAYFGISVTNPGTFTGIVDLGYVFNRALSPSEVQQLYAEPYGFIRKPKKIIIFPSAGVAPENIIISNATISARAVLQSPTVTTGASVTITNATISAQAIIQSPTLRISEEVATDTINVNVQAQSPSLKLSSDVVVDTITGKVQQQDIVLRISAGVAAGLLSNRIILQDPTISLTGSVSIAVAAIVSRLVLQEPTISVSGFAAGVGDIIKLMSKMETLISGQSRISQYIAKKSEMWKVITKESPLH